MRKDAKQLENGRLDGFDLNNYPWMHERHRIFPAVFKDKKYGKVLDIAAGMGVVSKRIKDNYPCYLISNDITESCLKSLKMNQLNPISFDLDNPNAHFPFADESFDAIISLATVEHILHLDHHMMEIRRILKDGGHLYISAPNYSGLQFIIPFVLKGKTFHNPLDEGLDRYEFYAHVRYFTYNTLLEFVSSFGFKPETVYLPLPNSSSRYLALMKKSKAAAYSFKFTIWMLYKILTPRWAFHPVLCFSKSDSMSRRKNGMPRKVII